MDEILRNLGVGTRVLDLGSLTGSFPADCCPGTLAVRVDLERPVSSSCDGFVQADAARLPFRDRCFDAVIANHSLEHIQGLPAALAEIGRVVSPGGNLFVAQTHRRFRTASFVGFTETTADTSIRSLRRTHSQATSRA